VRLRGSSKSQDGKIVNAYGGSDCVPLVQQFGTLQAVFSS
jgi:hypothetical protein